MASLDLNIDLRQSDRNSFGILLVGFHLLFLRYSTTGDTLGEGGIEAPRPTVCFEASALGAGN